MAASTAVVLAPPVLIIWAVGLIHSTWLRFLLRFTVFPVMFAFMISYLITLKFTAYFAIYELDREDRSEPAPGSQS